VGKLSCTLSFSRIYPASPPLFFFIDKNKMASFNFFFFVGQSWTGKYSLKEENKSFLLFSLFYKKEREIHKRIREILIMDL
jgi:hypothetical protein